MRTCSPYLSARARTEKLDSRIHENDAVRRQPDSYHNRSDSFSQFGVVFSNGSQAYLLNRPHYTFGLPAKTIIEPGWEQTEIYRGRCTGSIQEQHLGLGVEVRIEQVYGLGSQSRQAMSQHASLSSRSISARKKQYRLTEPGLTLQHNPLRSTSSLSNTLQWKTTRIMSVTSVEAGVNHRIRNLSRVLANSSNYPTTGRSSGICRIRT